MRMVIQSVSKLKNIYLYVWYVKYILTKLLQKKEKLETRVIPDSDNTEVLEGDENHQEINWNNDLVG